MLRNVCSISVIDLLWGTIVLEEIKFTELSLAAWSPEKYFPVNVA